MVAVFVSCLLLYDGGVEILVYSSFSESYIA